MSGKITEVILVNGGKVKIDLDSVSNRDQIFLRLGKRLIIGIVQDPSWQGFYLWHKVQGAYRYLGDITFYEEKDGSVVWKVYPQVYCSSEFRDRAVMSLSEQIEKLLRIKTAGVCVQVSSKAWGV